MGATVGAGQGTWVFHHSRRAAVLARLRGHDDAQFAEDEERREKRARDWEEFRDSR